MYSADAAQYEAIVGAEAMSPSTSARPVGSTGFTIATR
jgi:hypothetical protein